MPDVSQVFQDSPTDQRLARLQPGFGDHLQDLIQDVPGVGIRSGFRDAQEQAQLWQAALQKYGSPAVARQWVAPPGSSNHNKGLAADLSFADPATIAAVHAQAPNYGLTFPLSNENWHIEPQGIRGAERPAFAPPPGMPAVVNLARPAAPAPSGAAPPQMPQSQAPSAPTTQAPTFASLAAALASAAPQMTQPQQAPQPQGVAQNFGPPQRDPVAIAKALTQNLTGNLTLA